jgi:hypothetical protein
VTGVQTCALPISPATAANQASEITALAQLHTDMTAATPAGQNVIGYMGSLNFGPMPFSLTLQNAAYIAGNCLGGIQPVSIFRSTTQASATLAQIMAGWASGQTTGIVVYAFSKNPTNSTFTDRNAVVLDKNDAEYLITPPFTLTPVALAGATEAFASSAISLPVKNADTTTTTNIYIAFVAAAAITPTSGQLTDLFGSVSGVQD